MPDGKKRPSRPAVEQEEDSPLAPENLQPTPKASSNENATSIALARIASCHPVSPAQQAEANKTLFEMERGRFDAYVRNMDAQTKKMEANTKKILAEVAEIRAETTRKNAAARAALPSPEHKANMEVEALRNSITDRRLNISCAVSACLGLGFLILGFAAEGLTSNYPSLHALLPFLRTFGGLATITGASVPPVRLFWRVLASKFGK